MKETTQENEEKEIIKKKRLPQEIKDEIYKKVFYNIFFAIGIIIYFMFLNLGFYNIEKNIFIQDAYVFSIVILVLSIILFEKSYRNGKGNIAIYGLELLAVALFTLFTPYTYFYLEAAITKIFMMVPLLFTFYYVIKSVIICVSIHAKHKRTLSDVKEIVKKEKINLDENIEMDKDKEAMDKEKQEEIKVKNTTKTKKTSNKSNRTRTNIKKQQTEEKIEKKLTNKKRTMTKTDTVEKKGTKQKTANKKNGNNV